MANQFQIVEKVSEDSDGRDVKKYYLIKKILGVSLYKWSYVNFTSSFLGTLIIISNILCYAFVSNGISLIIHAASIYFAYKIGRMEYNSIYEAEAEIKEYVKKQTLIKSKKTKRLSTSNVLNYNIDVEKGVFEKEFQSRTQK